VIKQPFILRLLAGPTAGRILIASTKLELPVYKTPTHTF